MATTNDGRSHNQPSHEAQVKGGENSHKTTSGNSKSTDDSPNEDGRSSNKPSHEASVKGGQHSHSGSSK